MRTKRGWAKAARWSLGAGCVQGLVFGAVIGAQVGCGSEAGRVDADAGAVQPMGALVASRTPSPVPSPRVPAVIADNLYLVANVASAERRVMPGPVGGATPAPLVEVRADGLSLPATPYVLHAVNDVTRGKAPEDLAPGDYLVSDPAMSKHFLRRVAAVTRMGARTEVQTVQASLPEVVKSGSFGHVWGGAPPSVKGQPTIASEGHPRPTLDSTSPCSGPLGGCLPLTGITLPLPTGGGASAYAKVLDGHLNFAPSIDIGGQIGGFPPSVQEVHLIARGTIDALLDAEFVTTGPLSATPVDSTIVQNEASFVDAIGPLPVEETVQFTLSLRCELSAPAGRIEGGLALSSGVEAGARYDQGGWSAVASQYFDPTVIGPHFEVKGTAAAACYLQPRLDVFFYDVAGPGFFVEPHVSYSETFGGPSDTWVLGWGLDGSITGSVQVFGQTLADLQLPLFNVSWPLAQGTVGPEPPPRPKADPCATARDGGIYCGRSREDGFAGGDPDVLYDCESHKTASKIDCPFGCSVARLGEKDACLGNPNDPCSGARYGGMYCGQSTEYGFPGGTTDWLYDCENRSTKSRVYCPAGCHVAPPGQNDSCEPASCDSCPRDFRCQGSTCVCNGPVCGAHCCAAGDFCGAGGRCCDGTCAPGCPC